MDPIPNSPTSARNLWEKSLAQLGDEQLKIVLETTARTQKRDILVCASLRCYALLAGKANGLSLSSQLWCKPPVNRNKFASKKGRDSEIFMEIRSLLATYSRRWLALLNSSSKKAKMRGCLIPSMLSFPGQLFDTSFGSWSRMLKNMALWSASW